jgi:hypothetical protein
MSSVNPPAPCPSRPPSRRWLRPTIALATGFVALLTLAVSAHAASPPGPSPTASAAKEALSCDEAFSGTQNARKNTQLLRARELATLCLQSCPAFARADCVRWLHEIDESTPTILFHVEGAEDAAVYIDGKRVADHLDGRAIEVDPGRHRFHAIVNGSETQAVEWSFPKERSAEM